MSNFLATESPRRELSSRAAETVDTLARATRDELEAVGYDALTVRSVAARAGVAPATAYNYFSSKEHLVAEVFWRQLAARSHTDIAGVTASERATSVVRALTDFLTDEADLAHAATPALLGPQPDVHALRLRIGGELVDQFRTALGPGVEPEILTTLSLTFSGAMLQAGMGLLTYEQMGDTLATAVRVIVGERP